MSNQETQIAGANYIYQFYNDAISLINYYAQYLNLILELKERGAGDKEFFQNLNETQQQTFSGALQMVRQQVFRTHIVAKSIHTAINSEDKETFEKLDAIVLKFKKTFAINEDDLEDYVTKLNDFLIKDIIKDILQSSHDIVTQLSGDYADDQS